MVGVHSGALGTDDRSRGVSEQQVNVRLVVNGTEHRIEVAARRLLSDALRYDVGLTGTHEVPRDPEGVSPGGTGVGDVDGRTEQPQFPGERAREPERRLPPFPAPLPLVRPGLTHAAAEHDRAPCPVQGTGVQPRVGQGLGGGERGEPRRPLGGEPETRPVETGPFETGPFETGTGEIVPVEAGQVEVGHQVDQRQVHEGERVRRPVRQTGPGRRHGPPQLVRADTVAGDGADPGDHDLDLGVHAVRPSRAAFMRSSKETRDQSRRFSMTAYPWVMRPVAVCTSFPSRTT